MSIVAMLGLPLLACLLLTGILSYRGLHVLKREVIFIDIAVDASGKLVISRYGLPEGRICNFKLLKKG